MAEQPSGREMDKLQQAPITRARAAIDLDRLARNVADGERRIAAQEKLIERRRVAGKPTHDAEMILREMEDLLGTMRSLLADMRGLVEGGVLPGATLPPLERGDEDVC